MSITVLSQPGCQPCKAVARYLDKREIDYTYVDVTQDADALAKIRDLGYQQTPVVIAGDEHFSGFQPTRLDQIIATIKN
ncbi:glutaredoxin family protein [Rhodococcus qingshengii]|uniref:glutaredoxin family protein n=1 Tax=Rhodococcus TaxID=1827 RepID=UPI001E3A4207|nr:MULTISPECIES: glutaredoxin family protein [Rhodococcus]MCD2099554.1 glutaredoxin family protein [Rhodococcus rhodochrous]MCD2123922.1 glutaredoxin family protein [Rhodococcus rhodochrous]MCQ4136650.1 glutaredoxin family protein [Rhodococcus rhodochrous]MDJ0490563.1 glutaredoxin family protein [Rhodococcus qingshengii]